MGEPEPPRWAKADPIHSDLRSKQAWDPAEKELCFKGLDILKNCLSIFFNQVKNVLTPIKFFRYWQSFDKLELPEK